MALTLPQILEALAQAVPPGGAAAAPRALPDTIVTIQLPVAQGLFGQARAVASGLVTLAVLVLTVALVPAAWNFRKSYQKVNSLLERVYGDVNPIMRHVSTITDNLNYITTAVRVDVQQLQATVASTSARLSESLAAAEHRLAEMNALLDVVQREAEEVFVTTASAMRGIRTGVTALQGPVVGDPTTDDENDFFTTGDESHGYDDAAESHDALGHRPRVRPRPREPHGR